MLTEAYYCQRHADIPHLWMYKFYTQALILTLFGMVLVVEWLHHAKAGLGH